MIEPREGQWQSADGLALAYREYDGGGERYPVLCLHGLTRNARDFASLAPHIASKGRRAIVPDIRGRGRSECSDDSATYSVSTYVDDVLALLEALEIERFVSVGTSMGGLITMVMAAGHPGRIAGAVLNDIGPVVEPAGLNAIRSYVGQQRSFPTWMHAARALRDQHSASHPTFGIEDWLAMAKRGLSVGSNGRISFDYDMKIAEPIQRSASNEAAVPPDLWPAFESLATHPVLVVRGEVSQLLSAETFDRMVELPNVTGVAIPETGHAPTLDEPEARAAIDKFIDALP